MVISRTNTYPFRVQFRSKLPRLLLAHFAGFPNQREINCLPNSNPMLRDRESRILPRMAAHKPVMTTARWTCERMERKESKNHVSLQELQILCNLLLGGKRKSSLKSSLPLKGKDYLRPILLSNNCGAERRFSKNRHKEQVEREIQASIRVFLESFGGVIEIITIFVQLIP